MAVENDLKVFSLRLPAHLASKIDQRAGSYHRTRNSEICVLLEMAVDLALKRDAQISEHVVH